MEEHEPRHPFERLNVANDSDAELVPKKYAQKQRRSSEAERLMQLRSWARQETAQAASKVRQENRVPSTSVVSSDNVKKPKTDLEELRAWAVKEMEQVVPSRRPQLV